MDLRIGPAGRRDAEQPPPAPQLQWARVCQLEGPGAAGAKAAAAASGAAPCVFAAGRSGVRRWLATGRSEAFLPAEAAPAGVHALAVVPSAGSLFCCAADGNVTCFDLQSGAKQRVFSAHIGEVVCATSWVDPRTGAAFVATGGVDVQVKTWGPDGRALGASGQHHGRVNCLLAMPPPAASVRLLRGPAASASCAVQPSAPAPAPANTCCASGCGSRQASQRQPGRAGHPARGSTGGPRRSSLAPGGQARGVGPTGPGPLLVSGCTDGSVLVWEDHASTGLLSEAEGVWLRHPLQKGVTSLLGVDSSIWAGCADGHIVVWQPAPGGGFAFQRALKPHTDQVSCLLVVGRQVWSGSTDRSICASDAASGEMLFRIPDQGGYIKSLVPFGWTVWAFTSKGMSVLASEASWLAAQERGGALELAASAAEVERLAVAVQEQEAEVCRPLKECEAASEREASAASALAAERGQHEAALACCRAQHQADLEAQRAQHAANAAAAQQQWELRLAVQQAQHAEECAALRGRLEAAAASHAATCATQQAEHARLIEQLAACQRQLAEAQQQLAEAQQQLREHGGPEAAADDLIAGLKSELERARSEGAHALAALREEHTAQLAALAATHSRELSALREEAEAAAAAQQAQHAKQMADAEAACTAQLEAAQRALQASNHTATEQVDGLQQELQRLRSAAAQHAQQAEAAVAMARQEERQFFEERLAAQQAQVAALQQEIVEQQQQAQRAAVEEQLTGRQRVLTLLDASTQAGEPGGAAGAAAERVVLLQLVAQLERERQAPVAEATAESEELRLLQDKVQHAEADLAAAAAALQREQHRSTEALAASASRVAELEHMLRELQAQHATAEQRAQQAQQEAARQHAEVLQALREQQQEALAAAAEQQRLSAAETAQQSQAQLEAARQRAAQEAATQAAATMLAEVELGLARQECSRLQRDCQGLRQQLAHAQGQATVMITGSGGQQQGPARSGAQQRGPSGTTAEEKLSQELQSLRHNLAREAAAHAATRERIADLEAALQEALAAYQALSVQLRTMTRQQQQAEALAGYQGMPDQLQAMKRQQQQLQHPGQQKSPRQQQRAQQQEQCPEPGQQQPAQPTQQTQQVALLLERLSRAEEGLQQRDACLEALQRANALLFSHAQAVGGDLRGYETELQRAGATLRELHGQRPSPPAGPLAPSPMAMTTGMVDRAVPGSPVALSPGQLQPCQWPLAAASGGGGHVAAVLSPGAAAGGGPSHGVAMLAPGSAAGGGSPEARVQAGRVRFLPPNGALW